MGTGKREQRIPSFNPFSTCLLSLCMCFLSRFGHVPLCVSPWTVACQTPLSMRFSRQEYWSGLPFPILGDLPDPGIEPPSSASAGGFLTALPPGKLY